VTHFVDVRESGPNHAVIDLPTGSVSGQVLDKTTGAPVAGLIVGIVRAKADAQGAKPDRRQVIMVAVTADSEGPAVTRVGLDGTAPVRTDEDGRFLVRYLAADTYNVSVSGGDYTPATQRDVVVKEALETKRVDLQVDRGSTLLVTAEGASNPRVFLARLCRDGEESTLQVEVSSDGRPIRFQGLSPGRYRVEVTVPMEEGVKGQQEVDVPGGGLEIPVTVKLRAT
jgi:5-hydroxyisourate hydrolase-like protein (transthyretin family)